MNKKIIIIIASAVVLLAAAGLYFGLNKNKKISITFDSVGGSTAQVIEIEKNNTAKLPTITKEGYKFLGWYLEEEKIDDTYKFEKDTKLIAKWEKIETGGETQQVANPIDKATTTKKTTTKKTTTKKTTTKATTTTTAAKTTTTKATPKTTAAKTTTTKATTTTTAAKTTTTTTKVTYKCERGWALVGSNCIKRTNATLSTCDPDFVRLDNSNECVKISEAVRKDPLTECKTKTVPVDANGHTQSFKGEKVFAGTTFCYYGVVADSSKQGSRENCTSPYFWNNSSGKCYYLKDQDTIKTCADSGYDYINNPNDYEGKHGINMGCFPVRTRYTCPTGYKLAKSTNGRYSCVSTIKATVVK